MRWFELNIWSIWIVGGRYITCLSRRRDFDEVLEAVKEKANEMGGLAAMPLVLISYNALSHHEFNYMLGLDEGDISVILE
jgi:hypothetical protein